MQTRDWQRFPQAVRRAASTAGRWTTDFLYPPDCGLCRRPLPEFANRPRLLCADCCAGVAPPVPHRCRRCSAPVGPHLDTNRGCVHCRADRFAFESVVSLGVYEGLLRAACSRVKQQTGDVLAAALAELLVEREFAAADRHQIDLIIPVPHHWSDRLLRRHLPPVSLATRLARLLSVSCSPHILAKVRRTRPQTELSRSERRNNLRGAFRLIGKSQLTGLRALLVDDVLTTGTTAHRAAAELKRAGATVNVAVLARGIGHGTASSAGSSSGTVVSQPQPATNEHNQTEK